MDVAMGLAYHQDWAIGNICNSGSNIISSNNIIVVVIPHKNMFLFCKNFRI